MHWTMRTWVKETGTDNKERPKRRDKKFQWTGRDTRKPGEGGEGGGSVKWLAETGLDQMLNVQDTGTKIGDQKRPSNEYARLLARAIMTGQD